MIGEILKFKIPPESKSFMDAYDVIQLTEPHEAGEIINDYWLIENESFVNEFKAKFDTGYYVRIVNLNLVDLFITDINYDDKNDLMKYGRKIKYIDNNIYDVNIHRVK